MTSVDAQSPVNVTAGKLPPGDELLRQYKAGATYEAIGGRYGATRQAVHKRIRRWLQLNAPAERDDS